MVQSHTLKTTFTVPVLEGDLGLEHDSLGNVFISSDLIKTLIFTFVSCQFVH